MTAQPDTARFNADRLIARLARFADALPAVVSCIDSEDASWRPDDSSWSVIEIVCHLVDEELEDFRTRTLMTLQQPDADWPPIDPEGWANSREYQSQNLSEQLERFVQRRRESIDLLRAIDSPDWSRTHTHPKLGDFSAGQMLACWCAHDALHLRQLSKRMVQLVQRDARACSTEYAGDW